MEASRHREVGEGDGSVNRARLKTISLVLALIASIPLAVGAVVQICQDYEKIRDYENQSGWPWPLSVFGGLLRFALTWIFILIGSLLACVAALLTLLAGG